MKTFEGKIIPNYKIKKKVITLRSIQLDFCNGSDKCSLTPTIHSCDDCLFYETNINKFKKWYKQNK